MPGRHSSHEELPEQESTRARGPLVVLGTLALVGALAVGGWVVLRPIASEQADCTGSITLRVNAVPDVAPTVTRLAEQYEETGPEAVDRCIQVSVDTVPAGQTANEILTLSGILPNLWIPDTSVWADQVQALTEAAAAAPAQPVSGDDAPLRPRLDVSGSLATSPLVIVAPKEAAAAIGGEAQQFSWAQVLGGNVKATVSAPTSTSEGLVAALTLNKIFGAGDSRDQLIATMLQYVRSAVPDVNSAYDAMAGDPANAPVFPASEKSVIDHNKDEAKFAALYATEGAFAFNYPVVRVRAAETPNSLDVAAQQFEDYLRSPESVEAFLADGLRNAAGESKGLSPDMGVRGEVPASLGEPQYAEAAALLKSLSALSLDARLLAVIDVSGSMLETSPDGKTRIELASTAAKQAIGLFQPTSEVGLWAFSTDQDPPNDWVELVPTAPLGSQVDGVTQASQLIEQTDTLVDITRGHTALYDTALAAYRTAKAGYDAGKINSVVLLTDGENDNPDGLSFDSLLTALRAEVDPARPVLLITIGIGPSADMESLQQISALTGAAAYQAVDPNDIGSVFLDAMAARITR